jgi:DNA polymerase-3 subunit chi
MKIDFWQFSRDPVEKVVTLIAQRVLNEGERLLVVSNDPDQRDAISRGLWKAGPELFLANGEASAPGAQLQPILLAENLDAANGASHVIFADGEFREPSGFARAFLLFDEVTKPAARKTWSALDDVGGLERSYFEQVDGKWIKKR